jgi:hypothetical protein
VLTQLSEKKISLTFLQIMGVMLFRPEYAMAFAYSDVAGITDRIFLRYLFVALCLRARKK